MGVMDYYHQGVKLNREGDPEGAIRVLNTGLEEYPDNFTILDCRAAIYLEKGEREKALADYNRMIALRPDFPEGWNCRGNMYHEDGEYDKAIADFTACIPMSPPGYGSYWSNRGISYYVKGDLDAALADFTKSIECWTELPRSDPSCASWALMHRGLVWRRKGELDKALADLTLAATYEPDDDFVFNQLGYIWFMREDFDQAIDCFSKAIEIKGDDAASWIARGVCYWNKCRKEKIGFWDEAGGTIRLAIDDFTKAIELSPEMADAYFNRGIAHCAAAQESNNLIKSIILQKVTDDAERLVLLAQLDRMGGKDFIPQADALLRGLRSNRDQVDVLMGEGLGLIATNDAEEAIEDLTRAIELAPDNAEAYYQRGLAYALLGQRDKALADYEQTCNMDPDHDRALEKRDTLREHGIGMLK